MPWIQLTRDPDILTDLLREVHSSRRVFARSELRARWVLRLQGTPSVHFHAVERGRCWLLVPGQPPTELNAGDVALLPRGGRHRLASHATGRGPTFTIPDPREVATTDSSMLRHEGPGEPTILLCGVFGGPEGRVGTAFATLPSTLIARGDDPRNRWLIPTLQLLLEEARSARPGAQLMVERLSDALFVQFIRDWILRAEDRPQGVLAALRDHHVGRALALMHRDLGYPWTVEQLARRVGLSRSRLAVRFRELVGESPHAYLTELRLRRATDLLQTGSMSIEDVAGVVGYRSAAAFSKAFSRRFGVSPRRYSDR